MLYQPEVRLTSHPLASNMTKPAPFSDIFPLKIALTHYKKKRGSNQLRITYTEQKTYKKYTVLYWNKSWSPALRGKHTPKMCWRKGYIEGWT
jgi:hypothetical protein